MSTQADVLQDPTIPEWTLGWRIKRAIEHAGLTNETLAPMLGMSAAQIGRWTRDKHPVRAVYLRQIALICKVPYEWLAHGVAQNQPTSGCDDGDVDAELTVTCPQLSGFAA